MWAKFQKDLALSPEGPEVWKHLSAMLSASLEATSEHLHKCTFQIARETADRGAA